MNSFADYYCFTEAISDYMPELFEFIKNQPDDALVHFSNWFRVGHNIKPSHQDPIGVYCFPKKYVLSPAFKNNHHFFGMKNAFILRPQSSRILNLSTITLPDVERLAQQMGLTELDVTGKGHHSLMGGGAAAKPGHILWDAMEKTLANLGLVKPRKNYQWNKWFTKVGIDILVDDGDSIIHSNEPYQVVFLSPGTFKEVTHFQHNVGNLYKSLAVRFMNSLGAKMFDNGKFSLRWRKRDGYSKEVNIYLSGVHQGNPLQIYSTYYENERDRLDQPLSLSINFHSHLGTKDVSSHYDDPKKRIQIEFDPTKPDIEQHVNQIVKLFKSQMGEEGFFRQSKDQYVEALAKAVLRTLGITAKLTKPTDRESIDFAKRLKDFGTLDGTISYHNSKYDEEGPHYHLGMRLKAPKADSYYQMTDLYGDSKSTVSADEVESGNVNLAAEKLVRKTIAYWKQAQETNYPTDYDKYSSSDWNSVGKMKQGEYWKKFIAWVENQVDRQSST